MPNLWITTHWPHAIPRERESFHIYLKRRRRISPARDDLVLIYETKEARMNGELVREVERRCAGRSERMSLPDGSGTVCCAAVVAESLRALRPDDVVYEYGNLREWAFIAPCRNHEFRAGVPYREMLSVLDLKPRTPPFTLGLRRIDDAQRFSALVELFRSSPSA